MALTFGSLFAGIGGLDLGLERAGMECRWQVEINDYATRVLAKHWPHVRRYRDVREFPDSSTERVDVICGGFPCQDISDAGRRSGITGSRSGLFAEALRVAGRLRPKFIVLENVAALLHRGMETVSGELAKVGFHSEWHCIPASAFGAPHIRDRIFILGVRFDSDYMGEAPESTVFQEDSDSSGACRRHSPLLPDTISSEWSEWRQQFSRNGPPPWKSGSAADWEAEPGVGRVADGVPYRVDRLRGLGNAVVPQVAEFTGGMILWHHEKYPAGTSAMAKTTR